MGTWGHKIPEYHQEVFGDDEPHSLYFIIMKLADFWEMHPLRPELTTLLAVAPEVKSRFDRFVQQIPVRKRPTDRFRCGVETGLEDVAPGCHFIPGFHRSANLVPLLKRDGQIRIPAVVFFGKGLKNDQWKNGYVYEGKHRIGAAVVLGWPTAPALVLHTVGALRGPGISGMTLAERKQMQKEQQERGLPDSSRIHGLTLQFWSEKELRTFMRPRPHDKDQYYTQNKLPLIRGCTLDHPDWQDVPRGIVIKKKAGSTPLPWEIKTPLQ